MPYQGIAVRNGLNPAKWLVHLVMSSVFAFTLLVGSHAAMAADDEEDEDSIEEKFMKSLLGHDKPVIDYRERSPLVVPPSATLPAPETGKLATSPGWPKDADIQVKKKVKKNPYDRGREDTGRPLNPDQVAGRGAPGSGSAGAPSSRENERGQLGLPDSPYQSGNKGNLFGSLFSSKEQSESAVFPGEAPRGSLTEPPKGYMTPSPNYPYGVGPAKAAPVPYRQKIESLAVGRD